MQRDEEMVVTGEGAVEILKIFEIEILFTVVACVFFCDTS
jgi:hypothetical protein